MQIGSGTRDLDVEHILRDVEDHKLREEVRSCQPFFVDSELERARRKVFTYAVETLNETIVNEKVDHFFNNLRCAAKVNWAFGFFLKNIEDGGFRYFYAHQNNTLLDRSKLVCTHDDLAELTDFFDQTNVIESCSREKMSTKWMFYKLTNLAVFAALLKHVPMGCKDAVLPEPLLRNQTINCLTFEENTILDNHITITCASFVRLLSICMVLNDWKKKLQFYSKLFINKMDALSAHQF